MEKEEKEEEKGGNGREESVFLFQYSLDLEFRV
jgi:hypothetical protein